MGAVDRRAAPVGGLGVAVVTTAFYALAFPAVFSGSISGTAWRYLTPLWGAASIALGVATGVLTGRWLAGSRGRTGLSLGLAVIGLGAALVPTVICCTGWALAVVRWAGVPPTHVWATVGAWEAWAAVHDRAILVGAVCCAGSGAACLGRSRPKTPGMSL
jgi:hypothetical protein